jgi:hypothetical protein
VTNWLRRRITALPQLNQSEKIWLLFYWAEITMRPDATCRQRAKIGLQIRFTIAIAKPSHPLLPTVWIAVALKRGSLATISKKRRMP